MNMLSKLEGDGIIVRNIFGILNLNRLTFLSVIVSFIIISYVFNFFSLANFVLAKQKYDARAAINNDLFFSQGWRDLDCEEEEILFREFTHKVFLEKTSLLEKCFPAPQNESNQGYKNSKIKVIPTIYGTSAADAWNICVEGIFLSFLLFFPFR